MTAAVATKPRATMTQKTGAPPPVAAIKPPTVTNDKALLNRHQRFDPYAQLLEAEAVINALGEVDTAIGGVLSLIGAAKSAVETAGAHAGSWQAAADRLEQVLAVMDVVEAGLDHSLLYGGGALIALAKVQIDAKINQPATAAAAAKEDGAAHSERPTPAGAKSTEMDAVIDAHILLSEAVEVLKCRLVELPGPARGAYELLKIACDTCNEVAQSGEVDGSENASVALFVALEVLGVVSERAEDLVADAALRLAWQAKSALDGVIDQMIQERRS